MKKEIVKETPKEVDYPRRDLESIVPVLKKIVNDQGGVVTRSMLAGMFDVGEKGGGFSHIVYALKQYKVVDKSGQSDFRVSEIGSGVAKGDKSSVQRSLLSVPVFKDLNERYATIPNSKSGIKDYLKSKYQIDESTANTIATRFIKNMKYLNTLEGSLEKVDSVLKEPQGKTNSQINIQAILKAVGVWASLKANEMQLDEAIKKLKELDLPSVSVNEIVEYVEDSPLDDKERKMILITILTILKNNSESDKYTDY